MSSEFLKHPPKPAKPRDCHVVSQVLEDASSFNTLKPVQSRQSAVHSGKSSKCTLT